MTALVQDLRLAVRVLLGARTWTLVVLLSLALGIGANTALFTAVNGLLLQTVNVDEPERLVRFNHAGPNDMVRNSNDYGYSGRSGTRNVRSTFSFPMIEQLRAANTTLTGLAAGVPMGSLNVIVDGDARLATGYQATGNYFTVIGVRAVLGRVFGEADDRPSAPPVAVISHAYWSRRFAGEPSAIGRVVSINGQMVTIVGVTPADFAGIERLGADAPDVTVPLAFDALFAPPVRVETPRMQQPTYWWLQLVGRLKPGVSIEQARANFATVFQRTAIAGMAEYQSSLTADQKALSTNRQRGTAVPAAADQTRPPTATTTSFPRRGGRPASSASSWSIVLLIVCANVATLLLTRATARSREIAVRLSIGATRGRLIRQLLTESILLSSLGGALGGLLAYWLRGLLPFGQKAPLDWRVFGFLAGVSMLTGIVFGLLPALRATRVDLAGAMKESSRSVTGSRSVLSKGLVVLQVAMSLVLLVGAGLFLRTLENLKRRGRRVRFEEPADVQREPAHQRLRPRARLAALRPGARADGDDAWREVGRTDARAAALGDHVHGPDVEAGAGVAGSGRRDHVQDGRLAGVLRDDGDSRSARPKLHRSGWPDRTQGGDPQRGGRAHSCSRTATSSGGASASRSRSRASSRSSAWCATRSTRASATPARRRCTGASGRPRSETCTSC